jgi:ATP-dependent 26S proteasome regulatory subunit
MVHIVQIQIPLPPKIDPSVTMMTVEEKPDVTYRSVGEGVGGSCSACPGLGLW